MNTGTIKIFAAFAVLLQLSLIGFVIWVIFKLLAHFGVI